MIKQICQFIAAAGLVGVALTPLSAEAKFRTVDGHGCRVTPGTYSATAECPIDVGTEFNPATINFIMADMRVDPGAIETAGCRRAWSGYTVTCGASSWEYVGNAATYSTSVVVWTLRDGNVWDHRWVWIKQHRLNPSASSFSFDVSGVYVENGD